MKTQEALLVVASAWDRSCCHRENLRYPDGRVVVVVSEPCENHREGLL